MVPSPQRTRSPRAPQERCNRGNVHVTLDLGHPTLVSQDLRFRGRRRKRPRQGRKRQCRRARLLRHLVGCGRHGEEPHRGLRGQDRPQGRVFQLAMGAVPRDDGHQVHRQGADRHAMGVRQLAARMGGRRLDPADRPVQDADRLQCRRRSVLRQLHVLQGQAVRHHLLHRLHGLHLQRRAARQGRHQGAARHLGGGHRAGEDHQGQGPLAVAGAAGAGAGDVADRVPRRHDLLAGRPLHGRQGPGDHAGSPQRRAHRAALGGRRACRSTRSSRPSCVETGELAAPQELLGGPARLRADAEVTACAPSTTPSRARSPARPRSP